MIEFSVLESNDPDQIGKRKIFKNLLYFGLDSKDLSLEDEDITKNHLIIEIDENRALVDVAAGHSFLLNGKRCESTRPLNAGDKIQFGKTLVEFHQLVYKTFDLTRTKINEAKENLSTRVRVESVIDKINDRIDIEE